MAVRIGVDVGGTFTKAVACDDRSGDVVASVSVPTTHHAVMGVSEGIVAAAEQVRAEAKLNGDVAVIAHSSTQAVNALLEGDTALVGVVGLGARPDLRRSFKRTRVGEIAIAPGRSLRTIHGFIDCTAGLHDADIHETLESLLDAGAEAVCVSQAFGVEDPSAEARVARVARAIGIPSCAGHELTGLYGLEMRTVTGAVNASILPKALETASFVEEAFSNGHRASLLVMRGDGGAADLATMRTHPLATAFSGPAASVAGALRRSVIRDGIVVEVGGTSTNISPIRAGRPVLSYIRVLDHMTCIRSLDARVAGIGGGSLLRAVRRRRGLKISGVGPRSAHIADLPYCAFAHSDLRSAQIRLISPRPGDPQEYVVLELPGGERYALTPTCAANALGLVPAGAYAMGRPEIARGAFEVLGAALGLDWRAAATQVMTLASEHVVRAIRDAATELQLEAPSIVGVGGGAGALVPEVAGRLGCEWQIPEHAEVISSIGDALSLIRVEIERTIARRPSPSFIRSLHRSVEEQAVATGAAPDTLHIASEVVPERRAVRAVATGSVGLETGVLPGGSLASDEDLLLTAKTELDGDPELNARNDFYSVFSTPSRRGRRWVVVDLRAMPVASGEGAVLTGIGEGLLEELQENVHAATKHLGPVVIAPQVRLVTRATVADLSGYSTPTQVMDAARQLLADTDEGSVALLAH